MNKSYLLLLLFVLSLTLTACNSQKQASNTIAPTTTSAVSGYTLLDVSAHKDAADCWTIIDGSVYDLTPYVESSEHPGGENIIKSCGVDSSKIFKNIGKHSSALTKSVLRRYYLGNEIK